MPQVTTDVKDTNPKDLVGQTKAQMWMVPPAGRIAMAEAFMDGAAKYQPYNWRDKGVRISVYISAIERHLMDYLDGENVARDSNVHHLGHIMACCAILLDATAQGNVVDDRPAAGAASRLLEEVHAKNENKNKDRDSSVLPSHFVASPHNPYDPRYVRDNKPITTTI